MTAQMQRLAQVWDWLDFAYTNPWTDGEPLSRAMIERAIRQGSMNPRPYPFGQPQEWDWTLADHMARIAYLVAHRDQHRDPIGIEVDAHGEPILMDGNHRLAAAWYLHEREIGVEFSGYIDNLPLWAYQV